MLTVEGLMAKTAKDTVEETESLRGRTSLFRDKIRKPVSLTLTAQHHRKVRMAQRRLGLTRADVIGLLIDRYADVVELSPQQAGAVKRTH
jgi:hypothetical protein